MEFVTISIETEDREILCQSIMEPKLRWSGLSDLETTAVPNLCAKLPYDCITKLISNYSSSQCFELAERFRSNPEEVISKIRQQK